MVASNKTSVLAFIDELLADQQRLQTPVALLAAQHTNASLSATGPKRSALRSQLIPLSAPRPGEHYAFEVDLDSCTGCKACVVACHSLNGLDETETWREVGLIVNDDVRQPVSQTVTTACHHCADPACLNGCPVLAYEKDPITGIVRHLDDQCIGCQYCILKCPYDVPKYNERLGIVRKCDMCHNRLAEGEAPACVQACPTQAIRIVTVTTQRGADLRPDTTAFLFSAPDPGYTQPTTRYVTAQPLARNVLASDAATLRPQPPHWPLVVMLTLTSMAVGCQLLIVFRSDFVPGLSESRVNFALPLAAWAWCSGIIGLAASLFHLGQPSRAWRIFLGWRKSWLSREALVFGAWFGWTTAALWFPSLAPAAAAFGLLGLFCSAMVYVDTRRVLWRLAQTAPRFFVGALILGCATAFALRSPSPFLGFALAAATLLKLGIEARVLHPFDDDDESPTPARQSARLLAGPFGLIHRLRMSAGLLGGGLLPLLIAGNCVPAGGAWLAFGLTFGAELTERYLFFRAVDAPKMPGLPSA